MVVNIFLLNGAIESFTVGVHLGCSGISVIMSDLFFNNFFCKVFGKLRTVVGLKALDFKRKNNFKLV